MEDPCYNDSSFEVVVSRAITARLLSAMVTEINSEERTAIYSVKKRILNNSFKNPYARIKDGCCGHCGKPFNRKQGVYCMYCGSFNTNTGFRAEHISSFALRTDIEPILTDAVITANDPELFLECLDMIEKPEDEKKYAELSEKILVKRDEPNFFYYRCGACGCKIHSGREMPEGPRFCPRCGIPFKRVRYTTIEENGFEQTIFRKPYHELFP